MKIEAYTIPHHEQRYPTCGDWWFDSAGTLQVRASDLGDGRKEACILVHEIVETLICARNGVTQEAVDAFDIKFEKNRKEGDESEPGDDPKAPYYNEHQIATVVERLLAQQLGLNWQEYEDAVLALDQQPKTPYPWCHGSPTKEDCAKRGYCNRDPNCGE